MRTYRVFRWKDSNFRVCSPAFDAVTREIVRQRERLEAYIRTHREFRTALTPVALRPGAPDIARCMLWAASKTGLGPMAAVAGAIAQFAAFIEAQRGHYLQSSATLALARSMEQAGRLDEARIVLEDFLAENADSQWAGQAEASLKELGK